MVVATSQVIVPGDDNKRDPERENLAVLTIAAQTANVIHIRVTFNAVTRYSANFILFIQKLTKIKLILLMKCDFKFEKAL